MRKSDKKKNFLKVNLLAEQRYLESKGIVTESYNEIDEPPMGVNQINEPTNNEMDLETNPRLLDNIMTGILKVVNPYINRQIGAGLANNNWEVLLKEIPILFNQELTRNRKYKDEFGKEYSKLNNVQGGELDEVNDFDDYEQDYNEYEKIHYISPERKSEIENLSNKYELSAVKFEKGVGGNDSVKYFNLEFRKTISREFGETDKHKYFWVNIIKDNVKISGKENLQSMIPDETKRHQFMMDVKNLVNSILENELA